MTDQSLRSTNPFSQQVAGELFVGREGQLREFYDSLNGLKAGIPRHFYVAGLHGTGKTSYLQKLVDLSSEDDEILAVLPTLDPAVTALDHISTIARKIAEEIDARNGGSLKRDWEQGKSSIHFTLPKRERLMADDLRSDFVFLSHVASESGAPKILICIDEGQRIEAFALSALKNALQYVNDFLIVLSIRVIDEAVAAIDSGRSFLEEKAAAAEGDYGASAFFTKGIPLGPFETASEAECCITRRLEGRPVSFHTKVVQLIGDITGRVPRKMISLASSIYDAAAIEGAGMATHATVRRVFKATYKKEYSQAEELGSELSEHARKSLRKVIEIGRPVKAEEVAQEIYPMVPEQAQQALVPGIKGDLDRICKSAFCVEIEDRYRIADPIRRFALQMALEEG